MVATTLQSMGNPKLSKQSFWFCHAHQDGSHNTPTNYTYVSFLKSGSLWCGLQLNRMGLHLLHRKPDFKLGHQQMYDLGLHPQGACFYESTDSYKMFKLAHR